VKPITLALGLLALAGAGCIGLPRGAQQTDLPKPPAAELVEPTPVQPQEVSEKNARDALKRLEDEIKFDEH
jgi:hypothetical protein